MAAGRAEGMEDVRGGMVLVELRGDSLERLPHDKVLLKLKAHTQRPGASRLLFRSSRRHYGALARLPTPPGGEDSAALISTLIAVALAPGPSGVKYEAGPGERSTVVQRLLLLSGGRYLPSRPLRRDRTLTRFPLVSDPRQSLVRAIAQQLRGLSLWRLLFGMDHCLAPL